MLPISSTIEKDCHFGELKDSSSFGAGRQRPIYIFITVSYSKDLPKNASEYFIYFSTPPGHESGTEYFRHCPFM